MAFICWKNTYLGLIPSSTAAMKIHIVNKITNSFQTKKLKTGRLKFNETLKKAVTPKSVVCVLYSQLLAPDKLGNFIRS